MVNLLAYPNETEAVARKRIEPEFTHWQIAVANAKHDNIRRKQRVVTERRIVQGLSYVMKWDADRFQTYAD